MCVTKRLTTSDLKGTNYLKTLTYSKPLCVVYSSRSMIRQHLKRDTLFSNGDHRPLVHVRIMDAHSAEDSKGLDKVLVILSERQIIEFVHQLDHSYDLARGVLDGHAEYAFVLEADALVDAGIEPCVFIRILDVDDLNMKLEIIREGWRGRKCLLPLLLWRRNPLLQC